MEMDVGGQLFRKDNFNRENDKIIALVVYSKHPICWLVGCFGFNGRLRQYCSLYLAVSQREGERGEKG